VEMAQDCDQWGALVLTVFNLCVLLPESYFYRVFQLCDGET
jgi:hypothetical protein